MPELPEQTQWERMLADYRTTNLSVGPHPLELLRPLLAGEVIATRGARRKRRTASGSRSPAWRSRGSGPRPRTASSSCCSRTSSGSSTSSSRRRSTSASARSSAASRCCSRAGSLERVGRNLNVARRRGSSRSARSPARPPDDAEVRGSLPQRAPLRPPLSHHFFSQFLTGLCRHFCVWLAASRRAMSTEVRPTPFALGALSWRSFSALTATPSVRSRRHSVLEGGDRRLVPRRLDRPGATPAACYRQAMQNAPTDLKVYSTIEDDLQSALRAHGPPPLRARTCGRRAWRRGRLVVVLAARALVARRPRRPRGRVRRRRHGRPPPRAAPLAQVDLVAEARQPLPDRAG